MFAARLIAIVTIGLIGAAWPLAAQEPDGDGLPKIRSVAVPRSAPAAAPATSAPPAPRGAEPAAAQRGRSRAQNPNRSGEGQGRAVPRQSRPREDNPPTGRAVPRGRAPAPPVARPPSSSPPYRPSDRPYYRPDHRPYYRPYYRPYDRPYSPWYYSPYFYGAFGFSYFYWDPYWYGTWGYYPGYGTSAPYYEDVGSVRLKLKPRDAQVFVDGYFVGIVDEFDGIFQRLRLPAGPHRIEVEAPGFEVAVFEVYVRPGQTITFERILQPRP